VAADHGPKLIDGDTQFLGGFCYGVLGFPCSGELHFFLIVTGFFALPN
jgi:hypothetical protein